MAQEVKTKFKETLKSTKELLVAIEEASRQQVTKNAPKVAHTLDKSFGEASKALSDFIGSLDKKTNKEQLELLRGYRYFLRRQLELLEGRITTLEQTRKDGQSQNA